MVPVVVAWGEVLVVGGLAGGQEVVPVGDLGAYLVVVQEAEAEAADP